MTPTVVIAGSLAQKPEYGGHAWVFLQYLLGFRQLGLDVLFIDRLAPEMCVDDEGRPSDVKLASHVGRLAEIMVAFGLGDSFTLLDGGGDTLAGLAREAVLERTRDSLFLLNVMGFLQDAELLAATRQRVFLDIDPGFPQMWRDLGLADVFTGHDLFVTIGERIGEPDCPIPTCGLHWVKTRQPIVLDRWPAAAAVADGAFTAIGAWRGPFAPIEYEGVTYGLRVHEFRGFADLPRRVTGRFEAALDIHPAERSDIALLEKGGWTLIDPYCAAGDPWRYQNTIARSAGEVMIAKGMYVRSRSGWFSDRSACYLASGKPVLAQDTGISSLYPVGDGLLTFATLDEAVAGIDQIRNDYARHARAARALAETTFESDRILSRLLEQLTAG